MYHNQFSSFMPPQRILMGAGPANIYPSVALAMAKPTIGHLDPSFIEMMDEVKSHLQYAFQTENKMTGAVSAPGSAGMEACFVNLVEPGDTVVVCINGVFGNRMKEIAERCGAKVITYEEQLGKPIDPEKLEQTLALHPDASVVAFVHAETSTGVLSDAQALCEISRKNNCLTIVDAVTSVAGSPVRVDEWGIDAVYTGSQKCLSCVPGLSPVTFSPKAVAKIMGRKQQIQSWFLDQSLLMGYWGDGSNNGKRSYHHTAPVNSLYALHEALVLLRNETLEASWSRHNQNHEVLRDGLEALGLRYFVDPEHRLPQLNAVHIPDGVDDAGVRAKLLNDYGLEIGGGLGALAGKIWRIGLMGAAANPSNVALCLKALADVLPTQH